MNRLGACKKGPIILCLSLLCSLHTSFAIAETEFALKDFKDAIFRLAIGESAHIRSMGLMSNSKIIADSTIYQTDLALDKLEFDVSGGQAGMSADLVAKIDKDRYSPASAQPLLFVPSNRVISPSGWILVRYCFFPPIPLRPRSMSADYRVGQCER